MKFQMNQRVGLVLLVFSVGASAFAKSESTYMIPKDKNGVLSKDLEVPLERAHFRIGGSQALLDYNLPASLDGLDGQRFRATGSRDEHGQWQLCEKINGTCSQADEGCCKVRAVCNGDERSFSCSMRYMKDENGVFALNQVAARAFLDAQPDVTPERKSLIEKGMQAFSVEGIGIVMVRKSRGRDR
jgi:hypothetical protein